MNREELIQELKWSLPDKRLIDAVAFGGVVINGEVVVLKNRFEAIPDNLVKYEKHYQQYHDIKDVEKKSVLFSANTFSRRGLLAIIQLSELMMEEHWDNLEKEQTFRGRK